MSAGAGRRGSIFWALMLIGIGVLFLLQNFYPSIHPWQALAKFWPFLLILWGISQLVQYFRGQGHPESPPRSLFSGGEAVLLVVVLILGSLFSKFILTPWHKWPSMIRMPDQQFAELFLNSYTFTRRISQPVKGNPRLLLVNGRGNVEIRGSEQPNIDVVLQETIWAENEAAARSTADRLNFHFLESGRQYELASNLDALPHSGRSVRMDMLIHVPKAISAEIIDNRGDIVLSGLEGNQTLTARHGDARVDGVQGLVRIHESRGSTDVRNVQGSVEIEGRGSDVVAKNITGTVTIEGNFSGALRFANIPQTLRYNSSRTSLNLRSLTGQLSMDMGDLDASGVNGPFELATRDKDINLENFLSDVKITNTNGDVHLQTATPPTRPIQVDIKKGDISLSLPAASNFQIDAVSRHGDVHSDFPGLKVFRQQNLPSLQGSYGKGGPLIHLMSTYGAIRVMRGNPQPPAPPSATATTGKSRQALESNRTPSPSAAP
ncbi:MAG TPA: DUF4097 family beta strand repeat-containing protein [Terriglobia bacterium]|nr:DUF4097 family beta strand repeat-containing protein [Terriglobia bacterium]